MKLKTSIFFIVNSITMAFQLPKKEGKKKQTQTSFINAECQAKWEQCFSHFKNVYSHVYIWMNIAAQTYDIS
jgi:hypothetical protein